MGIHQDVSRVPIVFVLLPEPLDILLVLGGSERVLPGPLLLGLDVLLLPEELQRLDPILREPPAPRTLLELALRGVPHMGGPGPREAGPVVVARTSCFLDIVGVQTPQRPLLGPSGGMPFGCPGFHWDGLRGQEPASCGVVFI